ncbi:hypothetical protein K3495_g432 [Podosphaera aphanis]|nr:hypothetical protein K3495_g432 [Podosphaera aphanis]
MVEVNAFVTTLGPENELILGFLWLELHNPTIDWQSKSLVFDKEYCAKNCLTPRTSNLKPASVIEIPDEGDIKGDMVKQPSNASKLVIIPDPAKHIQNKPIGELSSSKISNNLDVSDIKILNAPRLFQVSKDKDVHVMRIMAEDLEALDSVRERELSVSLLPEIDFQELLRGRGEPTPEHSKLKKITDKEVKKFFQKVDSPTLIKEEIKRKMSQVYHNTTDVALPQDAANLPPHRSYDHKIELLPGNQKFPQSRARPCSPSELRVIKRWSDDQLGKDWIRPSTSPVASPILLAKKPGGGIRICHDFRGINNITIKNRCPLPLIKESLDLICNAKIFTKFDVVSAFNRIRVAEGHEWLTAFITRYGLYEQLVTPFGLSGDPATF